MFICEALSVCLVYEKSYINKVALPCLALYFKEITAFPIKNTYQFYMLLGPVAHPQGPACASQKS
jgi:hypothetical protein